MLCVVWCAQEERVKRDLFSFSARVLPWCCSYKEVSDRFSTARVLLLTMELGVLAVASLISGFKVAASLCSVGTSGNSGEAA